jgi:hypothetical protein
MRWETRILLTGRERTPLSATDVALPMMDQHPGKIPSWQRMDQEWIMCQPMARFRETKDSRGNNRSSRCAPTVHLSRARVRGVPWARIDRSNDSFISQRTLNEAMARAEGEFARAIATRVTGPPPSVPRQRRREAPIRC